MISMQFPSASDVFPLYDGKVHNIEPVRLQRKDGLYLLQYKEKGYKGNSKFFALLKEVDGKLVHVPCTKMSDLLAIASSFMFSEEVKMDILKDNIQCMDPQNKDTIRGYMTGKKDDKADTKAATTTEPKDKEDKHDVLDGVEYPVIMYDGKLFIHSSFYPKGAPKGARKVTFNAEDFNYDTPFDKYGDYYQVSRIELWGTKRAIYRATDKVKDKIDPEPVVTSTEAKTEDRKPVTPTEPKPEEEKDKPVKKTVESKPKKPTKGRSLPQGKKKEAFIVSYGTKHYVDMNRLMYEFMSVSNRNMIHLDPALVEKPGNYYELTDEEYKRLCSKYNIHEEEILLRTYKPDLPVHEDTYSKSR